MNEVVRPSAVHHRPLDGIRGLAILAVMALHFTMFGGFAGDGALDGLFRSVAMGGWLGVDVFFVLSGFLITGILLDTRNDTGYFRTFYMRRTLRIFPLYFGFLIVMLVVLRPLLSGTSLFDGFDGEVWYWTYLTNVWFSFEGWPANEAMGHLWSLAVEEQFYLIWPLVVSVLGRRRLLIACVLLVGAGPFIRAGFGFFDLAVAADVNLLSRMDSLALGGLVAGLAREPDGLARIAPVARRLGAISVFGIAAIWIARQGFDGGDPLVYTGGFSLIAMASAWLIIEAVQTPNPTVAAVLGDRRLVTIGKYSYGLYVIHGPVSVWLPKWFTVSDLPTVFGSQIPAQLVYWVIGGSISMMLALLSWRLIEAPFLALKKRFAYVIDVREQPTVSETREQPGPRPA